MRKTLLIDELVAAVIGTDRQLDEHVVSTVAAATTSFGATVTTMDPAAPCATDCKVGSLPRERAKHVRAGAERRRAVKVKLIAIAPHAALEECEAARRPQRLAVEHHGQPQQAASSDREQRRRLMR